MFSPPFQVHYSINHGVRQVKYLAFAECEIIYLENCEISRASCGRVRREMKFVHIRKANISLAAGVFHISQKYFTCPEGKFR
jgi:hypothetical protein